MKQKAQIPVHESFRKSQQTFDQKIRYPLSQPGHKWARKLIGGPEDLGFEHSYITIGGIQHPPYAWIRNGKFLPNTLRNIKFWEEGEYSMPKGTSKIRFAGEGSHTFDTSA